MQQAFPFAPPPQYVQPFQLGLAPISYSARLSQCSVGTPWSGLQAQQVAASPVCVMDAEPHGLGARGLQSPPMMSAAPCGGFISMPHGAAATTVATVAAAPKAASKKKHRKERVYDIVDFRSMLCRVLQGGNPQESRGPSSEAGSFVLALPLLLACYGGAWGATWAGAWPPSRRL